MRDKFFVLAILGLVFGGDLLLRAMGFYIDITFISLTLLGIWVVWLIRSNRD